VSVTSWLIKLKAGGDIAGWPRSAWDIPAGEKFEVINLKVGKFAGDKFKGSFNSQN
jgi:hypothetical protein